MVVFKCTPLYSTIIDGRYVYKVWMPIAEISLPWLPTEKESNLQHPLQAIAGIRMFVKASQTVVSMCELRAE